MGKVSRSDRISEFTTVSKIIETDKFLITDEQKNSGLSSNSTELTSLYSRYNSNFSSISGFNPDGQWTFQNLYVDYMGNNPSAVVSYQYMKDTMEQQIVNLSNDLYRVDNPRIPSYPGQIIISDRLNSEEDLIRIYGGKKWVKLPGRMLFGAGEDGTVMDVSYSSYGKRGGATAITLKSIPAHTHVFKGKTLKRDSETDENTRIVTLDTLKFPMYPDFTIPIHRTEEGQTSAVTCAVRNSKTPVNKDKHERSRWFAAAEGWKCKTEYASESYSFQLKGSVEKNESNNAPLDIMPAYITEHIWLREK